MPLDDRKPMPDELVLSLALGRLAARGIVPPCEVRVAEHPTVTAQAIEISPEALRMPPKTLDAWLVNEIEWATFQTSRPN